jgi:3-keto-disaccharide hydrolase
MNAKSWILSVSALSALVCAAAPAQDTAKPFLGRWALTIPGGGAGWFQFTQEKGYLDGSVLWGGGSVVPLSSVYVDGDTLVATRVSDVERKDDAGKVISKQVFTETLRVKVDGDTLTGVQENPNRNGLGVDRREFAGKRIPPMPPVPDLSKVKYGEPIKLFNGQDLKGWTLTNPGATSGWKAENGLLVNEAKQEVGKPRVHYGNLRTEGDFEDFNLKLQLQVPPKGNSGIYLRGIYEVQVSDTYGHPVDPHNMGAIYSRITPAVSAEKPAGEWQDFDITLCDRHVTVKLNGKTILDNEPLLGCTGGALTSDEFKPGPIYLQGDHTSVKYRDMVLTPIVK